MLSQKFVKSFYYLLIFFSGMTLLHNFCVTPLVFIIIIRHFGPVRRQPVPCNSRCYRIAGTHNLYIGKLLQPGIHSCSSSHFIQSRLSGFSCSAHGRYKEFCDFRVCHTFRQKCCLLFPKFCQAILLIIWISMSDKKQFHLLVPHISASFLSASSTSR